MIPTTPTAYPSVLATKQHPDVGLINQQVWAADSSWARTGNPEFSGDCFGLGIKIDDLNIGEGQDYSQSSYNYSIQSDLNKSMVAEVVMQVQRANNCRKRVLT